MIKRHSHRATLLLLTVVTLILEAGITAQAQFRVSPVTSIADSITCHVGGETFKRTPDKGLIFQRSWAPNYAETQEIFNKVSDYTELRSNIYTVPVTEKEVNVEICPGAVNYIVYNPVWLKSIFDETSNLWSIYAIIAHEIGHYVKAHDRKSVGSNHQLELEADEYAGEILAKMGACLSDAQAAYRSRIMQTNQRSHTHPPIAKRLVAVETGWEKAGQCRTAQPEQTPGDLSQTYLSDVSLSIVISGQRHTIYIVPGTGSANIGAFAISGQNTTQTFYLGNGGAQVVISGQLNKIYVAPEISNRVRVIKSGQLNEVIIK